MKTKHQADPALRQKARHDERPVFAPSWALAFQLILVIRVFAAFRAQIGDCDEVYNYWEPLHYLLHGFGKQTWENTREYAIRSWSYPGLFALVVSPLIRFRSLGKWQTSIHVRLCLAVLSAASEAFLYRSVVIGISPRVGRYMLCFLVGSAGMWSAATALLPSSTAMILLNIALGYEMLPKRSAWPGSMLRRQIGSSIFFFLVASLFAWPFVGLFALPFILERFASGKIGSQIWLRSQTKWTLLALLCALASLVPIVTIDSFAYGRPILVVWNIIRYNVLSHGRGPELYGTEPWHYYLMNMTLAFNAVFWLALLSLPLMALSTLSNHSSATRILNYSRTALWIRLTPFYLWLVLFSAQAHKEERFMYPAYPSLCFNAAVSLVSMRDVLELLHLRYTGLKTTHRSNLYSGFTLLVIFVSIAISTSRLLALDVSYSAPMQVYHQLAQEIAPTTKATICVGKEWYRFPSSFFLPESSRLRFLKTGFDGCLPSDFREVYRSTGQIEPGWRALTAGNFEGTGHQNDLNQEEFDRYVDPQECNYLVEVIEHAEENKEPFDLHWTKVYCRPFLSRESSRFHRVLWTPNFKKMNLFDQYCLLKKVG